MFSQASSDTNIVVKLFPDIHSHLVNNFRTVFMCSVACDKNNDPYKKVQRISFSSNINASGQ